MPLLRLLALLLLPLLCAQAFAQAPTPPTASELRGRLDALAERKLPEAEQRAAQQALEQALADGPGLTHLRAQREALRATVAAAPQRTREARAELARLQAADTGATILHGHFHHFGPNGGVSGVLVLAESHVSIHTWPERDYAALDIFVCGDCDPYKAIPHLKRGFLAERVQLAEHKRGLIG